MADTPITPIISEITEMQAAFKQPSCNSKLPFVEYPSTGRPPIIDFNVPQNTAFTTYGHMVKYFPTSYFKQFCFKIPENNYFDMVKNMTAEQSVELFHPNVASPRIIARNIIPPNQLTIGGGFKAVQLSPDANTVPTASTTPTSSTPTYNPVSYPNPGAPQPYIPDPPIVKTPKADLKADYAANSLRPYDVCRLNGQAPVTKYVARPPQPVPRIIVIEEYTTQSYLGNYGAGRVMKTFSLFPGERTTISVRTYKDRVTTRETSQNVLDSFSEASATALDTLMQEEQGDISSTSSTSGGSGTSFTTSTDTRNSQKSFGISGSLNLGFLSIGGGYGKSSGDVSTSSGGMSSTYDYNNTASRLSNVNTLSSALNKHVQESNAARQLEVNTSTSDSTRTGEEQVTVRELQNVNLNGVLNLTFRNLLQEYTVITYLSNLKFAYTNGYPESYTVVDLLNLPNMLKDIIDDTIPGNIDNVLCKLLSPYCAVLNYEDNIKAFVEKFVISYQDCGLGITGCSPADETIYRIKKDLEDTYSDGVVDITVKGVILKVQKQTLQTSSLIADALLGRGDALDCFNQNAQNASNISGYAAAMQAMQSLTDNIQTTANNQLLTDQVLEMGEKKIEAFDQQMDVITGITDPLEKADKYKKVFGDCCDVPQSCCGGGCGCDCADHTEPTEP